LPRYWPATNQQNVDGGQKIWIITDATDDRGTRLASIAGFPGLAGDDINNFNTLLV